jgi:hypothetical protein
MKTARESRGLCLVSPTQVNPQAAILPDRGQRTINRIRPRSSPVDYIGSKTGSGDGLTGNGSVWPTCGANDGGDAWKPAASHLRKRICQRFHTAWSDACRFPRRCEFASVDAHHIPPD